MRVAHHINTDLSPKQVSSLLLLQMGSMLPAIFFFFMGMGMVTQSIVFQMSEAMKILAAAILLSNAAYLPASWAVTKAIISAPTQQRSMSRTWIAVGAVLVA